LSVAANTTSGEKVVAVGALLRAMGQVPGNEGHLLIIPNRHVALLLGNRGGKDGGLDHEHEHGFPPRSRDTVNRRGSIRYL